MIKGKKQINQIDLILSQISELDIFSYYLNEPNLKLNTRIYSPFRKERTPSFSVFYKNNRIHYVDFGDTSKKGGAFDLVMQLHNIHSLHDALNLVMKDFNLSNTTDSKSYQKVKKIKIEHEEKSSAFIQVITKKFTKEELAYWNQYYQDISDLKRENVYSIKQVFLNRKRFVFQPYELKFAYLYEDKWKIYRPYQKDKKLKWLPNNVPIYAMDGKENIINCDTAFITKSKKDYMVVKKIYPHTCAVQNEGRACFTKENVQFLKSNSKRQILSFDSDETGVKNSILITKEFNFDYCNVPKLYLSEGINDWADLAKNHGINSVQDYLKKSNIIKDDNLC